MYLIDDAKPKWMALKILAALKKSSKFSKKYYANPAMINKEELNSYSKYSSDIIIDAKEKTPEQFKCKVRRPE